MFTLIKVLLESIVAFLIFFGGMKFQQAFPNFMTKVDSLLAWIKNILPSNTPPAA